MGGPAIAALAAEPGRSGGCDRRSRRAGRSGGRDERRHGRSEKLAQRVGGHRPGEQEALGVVAAELLEPLVLRGPLDALGDAAEVEHAARGR